MKLIDCIKDIPNPMSMIQLIKESYDAVDFRDRNHYEYDIKGPFEYGGRYFWKVFRRIEGSNGEWKDHDRCWTLTSDPEEGQHELDIIRQLEQEKREKQAESDKRWNDRPKVPYKPSSPADYYNGPSGQWSGD